MKHYRNRITVQEPVATKTPTGETALTWRELFPAWALARVEAGSEAEKNGQQRYSSTCIFETWYRGGVTTKCRVLWDNRQWEVVDVINVNGRNMTMEVVCKLAH